MDLVSKLLRKENDMPKGKDDVKIMSKLVSPKAMRAARLRAVMGKKKGC